MKYWEFLIQKEGDQTWLPLETQQVEILEGRYRIVAHTDRADTEMEIWVSQLMTDELPPRKRTRSRIGQTNEAGLVVVMPFVHLKPGQWELNCSSLNVPNAGNDMPMDSWQYSAQLQVFARTEEDWSGEWPTPTDSETAVSAMIENDGTHSVDLEWANQDLPLIQAQVALKTRLQSQGLDISGCISGLAVSAQPGAANASANFGYQVTLRQQAYLAHPDQPMTIMGKVNALLDRADKSTSQLWIRLQNPETARVIMEAHRPLSLTRLPADFKVQIQLPAEVTTRVILGEVSLRTAALDPDDKVEILASTAFTITAGIAELLDAIANQHPGTFEEEEPVLSGSTSPSFDLPETHLPQTRFVPAVGVLLELPNLSPPDDTAADLIVSDSASDGFPSRQSIQSPVELPPINLPPVKPPVEPPVERAPMVSQPAQFLSSSIEDSDLEADEITAVLEDIDQGLQLEESDLDMLEAPGIEGALPNRSAAAAESINYQDDPVDWRVNGQAASQAASQASNQPAASSRQSSTQRVEADIDFQALKLKAHFWNRLSTLTRESHQEAAKISQNMKEAGVSRGLPMLSSPLELDPDSEVVIYDEPAATSLPDTPRAADITRSGEALQPSVIQNAVSGRAASVGGFAELARHSAAPVGRTASVRPPSQPLNRQPTSRTRVQEDLPEMALPVISVPMGDLVAGETIIVTVRTRPSTYKPFIKLWMVDRQSRSLVIEPQLLTKLLPDAVGDLEATTEMRIPMDCLDVQIAAIAVDMATQQESSKAIVNRHVIPANQSSFQREFGL